WYRFHAIKPALALACVALLSYVLVVGVITPEREISSTRTMSVDRSDTFLLYRTRSSTAFENILQRFNNLGIETVAWAVKSYGPFGAGLGAGSQGVQHLAVS